MTKEKLKIEIAQLKKDIYSDDWETSRDSACRLGKIGGDEGIDFLISLLASDDHSLINIAAIALRDNKVNRAVYPLLKSIFKKENFNYNGTLVYALEELDCSTKLVEIFKILFYHSYESQISANHILNKQIFAFTRNDLLKIKKMWDDIKLHPEKSSDSDSEEVRRVRQSAVDGFMGYLKPKVKKTNKK
ncbi:MAG: hypothetical protein HGB12_11135 [Bacteroidetes bacterium]|nr:hypothetical protein [Bacteroidota bacterium]